jgi:hypothetical protein
MDVRDITPLPPRCSVGARLFIPPLEYATPLKACAIRYMPVATILDDNIASAFIRQGESEIKTILIEIGEHGKNVASDLADLIRQNKVPRVHSRLARFQLPPEVPRLL